jgi:hypothetical protein
MHEFHSGTFYRNIYIIALGAPARMPGENRDANSDNCIVAKPRISDLDQSNITQGAQDLYDELECRDALSRLKHRFYKPPAHTSNRIYTVVGALVFGAISFAWINYYLAGVPESAFGDVWIANLIQVYRPITLRIMVTGVVTIVGMYFLYTRSRPLHGGDAANSATMEVGSGGSENVLPTYRGTGRRVDIMSPLETWYGDGAGLQPATRSLPEVMGMDAGALDTEDFLCVELRARPDSAGDILLPGTPATAYLGGDTHVALPATKMIEKLVDIPYPIAVQIHAVPRSDAHDRASTLTDRPTDQQRNSNAPPGGLGDNTTRPRAQHAVNSDISASRSKRIDKLEGFDSTRIFDVNVRVIIHVPHEMEHSDVEGAATDAIKPYGKGTNGHVTTTMAVQPVYNTPASSNLERLRRAYKRWRSPDIFTAIQQRSLRFTPARKYLRLRKASSRANFAATAEELPRYLLLPGQPSTKARRGLDSDPKDQTPTGRPGPTQRDAYTTSERVLDPDSTDQPSTDHDPH